MKQEESILSRVILKGVLGSIIQTLAYIFLLHVIWFCASWFFDQNPIPDNFYTLLSTMIFGSMVTTQNLLNSLINKKWFRVVSFLLVFAIYCIGWGDFDSFPFSASVSIIVGLLSLLFKIFLDWKIDQYFISRAHL